MLRVGVFFGGAAREREVSFAGGRTVYDNLDRSFFTPVPIFVDPWGKFLLLDWKNIYKGTIQDFYPPSHYQGTDFYSDSEKHSEWLSSVGHPIPIEELKAHVDVAFLILHGPKGEDGSIQGLLNWLGIPYVGSGIYASALGMDKIRQRKLMSAAGFDIPKYITVHRKEWLQSYRREALLDLLQKKFQKKSFVVKPANEGSSIGVSVLKGFDRDTLGAAIYAAFFIEELSLINWSSSHEKERKDLLDKICDIRKGPGLPLSIGSEKIYSLDQLQEVLNRESTSAQADKLYIEGLYTEHHVLVEEYIEGREFSCILIEDENSHPIPFPPTEIRNEKSWYDYKAKYLPGMSRKLTPISLNAKEWKKLREACVSLYSLLGFEVYARLDGFLSIDGKIFLNDPNTSSGMLPSSFLFHQAAEVGLSPTALLSYLIHRSLKLRSDQEKIPNTYSSVLKVLDQGLHNTTKLDRKKTKVAVLTGGGSSERHISLESARNVYEKLSSSQKYSPIIVFLKGKQAESPMYKLPLSMLLQDHADDIKEKLSHKQVTQEWFSALWEEFSALRKVYGGTSVTDAQATSYAQLSSEVDAVFIALHGRPGEDGKVQEQLEKVALPYNGSSPSTSSTTIDKHETSQLLSAAGFLTPPHLLIQKKRFVEKSDALWTYCEKELGYPMIAKPVDDGCSTSVCKIRNQPELLAYAAATFGEEIPDSRNHSTFLSGLDISPRDVFLLEKCISAEGADRFLEVSVGLLTTTEGSQTRYEVFPPSETLIRGDILTLEEKFLGGEGKNITPARFSPDPHLQSILCSQVQSTIERVAQVLGIEGYARVDAFVRVKKSMAEVIIIEVNSLPGLTPSTCLFHQAALKDYTPYELLDHILEQAMLRQDISSLLSS